MEKFVLQADFIVLDMKEDKDMPILFGMTFLATRDVVVSETKADWVNFRVDDDKVVIKEKGMKSLLVFR